MRDDIDAAIRVALGAVRAYVPPIVDVVTVNDDGFNADGSLKLRPPDEIDRAIARAASQLTAALALGDEDRIRELLLIAIEEAAAEAWP
jgi:hypothetical protein